MEVDFTTLFDEWSAHYDATVFGEDEQYREVFERYEEILNFVAERAFGKIVEFGVGTGNLSVRLQQSGQLLVGIEPSQEMRAIAEQKIPNLTIQDGHFLNYKLSERVDSIVSTYAFHHLTDEEKERAIYKFARSLRPGGKVIFADTMFVADEVFAKTIERAEQRGYDRLAADLKSEFYPTIPVLQSLFEKGGFTTRFTQMNHYVWVVEATKGE